jgi:hypothetical protein
MKNILPLFLSSGLVLSGCGERGPDGCRVTGPDEQISLPVPPPIFPFIPLPIGLPIIQAVMKPSNFWMLQLAIIPWVLTKMERTNLSFWIIVQDALFIALEDSSTVMGKA